MAVLQRFYAAEERYVASRDDRDFAAMTTVVHPDITVHSAPTLPYGGEWRGVERLRAFLAAFAEAWSALDVEDMRVLDGGDELVVVVLTMKATSRATGRQMSMPLTQTVRLRHGLIAEIRPFYWDTDVVNGVLGHVPMRTG
jgi:ketosteroid isomerase-like protein